jgi:hypothetical protein
MDSVVLGTTSDVIKVDSVVVVATVVVEKIVLTIDNSVVVVASVQFARGSETHEQLAGFVSQSRQFVPSEQDMRFVKRERLGIVPVRRLLFNSLERFRVRKTKICKWKVGSQDRKRGQFAYVARNGT